MFSNYVKVTFLLALIFCDTSDMDVKDGKIVAISESKEESVDEELSADNKEEEVVEETTEETSEEAEDTAASEEE